MAVKRKRGFAAALLVCLMLSATACGSGKAEDTVAKADAEKVREEAEEEMKARHQERMQSSQEAASGEESGKNGEEDGEEAADEGKDGRTREEQENGPDSEEAADDGYVRGKMTDTSYESEWIGLRYELPDGFMMSGEDEMDAILEAGGSMIYEDKAEDIVDYAKLVMVYEMMAKDRYGNVLTLFVEKTTFDIDTYVAAIKMQMGSVDEIEISMDDGETVEVGGVAFEKFSLVLDYGGMKVKENYYLKKKGDRMICLLIGYSDDETAEKMVSGFSPY